MQRHLICCDIDGTLMTSHQTISQQTVTLIKSLQNDGHLFYVATGRMFLSAQNIAISISEQAGTIASNGGILSIDEQIIKHTLSIESSLFVYRLAIKYALPLFFFSHDTIYYSHILPHYFTDETDKGRLDSGSQQVYHHILSEKDLLNYVNDFINAIIISEDHLDTLKIVKQELSQNQLLHITSSFSNNIEISPKGISKAIAIQELQSHYHISEEQTIAFGDGGNDIDMFNVSGISVAMENATDDVKKIAKYQTSSNNNDGVYQFLKNYFRNEEQ